MLDFYILLVLKTLFLLAFTKPNIEPDILSNLTELVTYIMSPVKWLVMSPIIYKTYDLLLNATMHKD